MALFVTYKLGALSLIRFTGYGLLLLALLDVINILVPPNFMNPVWEFQTLGALVEHAPVPLLGLVLVFMTMVIAVQKQKD